MRHGNLDLCTISAVDLITGRYRVKFWKLTLSCGHTICRPMSRFRPRIGVSIEWCGQCTAERRQRLHGLASSTGRVDITPAHLDLSDCPDCGAYHTNEFDERITHAVWAAREQRETEESIAWAEHRRQIAEKSE